MYPDRDTFEQYIAMADPDVQIRARPGYPDPEIRGARSQQKFFLALQPQFGLKLRGGPIPWVHL